LPFDKLEVTLNNVEGERTPKGGALIDWIQRLG
jgi:hypothetical protein